MVRNSIEIDGISVEYELIQTSRKTVAIEVRPPSTIIVRAPKGRDKTSVEEFLRSKNRWIEKALQRVAQVEMVEERNYTSGTSILILGQVRRIRVESVKGRSPKMAIFKLQGQDLVIKYDPTLLEDGESEFLRSKLIKFFRKEGLAYFREKTYKFAKILGVSPSDVGIRYYKSRWASTDSKKKITYNYRLYMAPIHVVNYVVVHELVHLIHFNHSPKFWQLVDSLIPRRKEAEEILRKKTLVYQL